MYEIEFYEKEDFIESLNYIHDTYVFDNKDKIEIEDIQETLLILHKLFSMIENENLRKEIMEKAKKEKKKESDMEM